MQPVSAGDGGDDLRTRKIQAMWYVTNQKHGVALGLQRILGLGSYQTAWAWLTSCGAPWEAGA